MNDPIMSSVVDIVQRDGSVREVVVSHFDALAGWEMARKFAEYRTTHDVAFRRTFTLEVLSYATLKDEENPLALTSEELIDTHLQTWENVKAVFDKTLLYNGIDPEPQPEKENEWRAAGRELAVSFIAACVSVMEPGLTQLASGVKNE